ncbi:MAG: alpha/beta fold hydrolase [Magnetococcales bacterium]|nr:alpha/beta fold hydrolase [Magnetococcales bacterium]
MGRRFYILINYLWILLTATALPASASSPRADLLLVHGYASGPDAWRASGVMSRLQREGWRDCGGFQIGAEGSLRLAITGDQEERCLYRVDLPSEASLSYQADALHAIMTAMMRKRPQTVHLAAGHSAGGVVVRLAMVRYPELEFSGLITVATPHLGTDAAKLAHFLAQTPVSMMAPFIGLGTLNRSQRLYAELEPESPGNFLYWLNHARHPKAHYLAIVRHSGSLGGADPFVAPESQDLTRVEALKGRAEKVVSGSGHSLEAEDGQLMAEFFDRWLADERETK